MWTRRLPLKQYLAGLLLAVFSLGLLPLTASFAAEQWKSEWDRVVAAAKKEGKVTIYSSGPGAGVDRLKVFKNDFEAAFPGIKSDYIVVASGSGSLFKIASERRAGKYIPDIYLGGLGRHMVL